MNRYFTFFLYSQEPSPKQGMLQFMDWLLQAVPHTGALQLIARELGDGDQTKPLIQGDFADYRRKVDSLELGVLSVSSLQRTKAGSEVFFRYEATGHQPAEKHLETITFSVRLDIWGKAGRSGLYPRLRSAIDQLFVERRCLYAYGHETPFVISGRFSLIGGNSRVGAPRIVDFDYTRYIEDVYQCNWIVEGLLPSVDEKNLCTAAGVECKILPESSGRRKALAIHFIDFTPKNVAAARTYLAPILWSESGLGGRAGC
jgi:hypothetical protein